MAKFRIAIGQIYQETNSFSWRLTGIDDFRSRYLLFNHFIIDELTGTQTEIGGFLSFLERADVEIIPTLAAWAMPGGRVKQSTYDFLTEALLKSLRAEHKLDGMLLSLHGAMASEAIEDADGKLLERVRHVLGEQCLLVVTLDWHANLTDTMVSAANLVVGYRSYPHQDLHETGYRAADRLLTFLNERQYRKSHVRRLPLMAPVLTSQSERSPMKDVIRALDLLESKHQAITTSVFLTQPWLDIPDFASTAILYYDESSDVRCNFDLIIDDLWDRRGEFMIDFPPTEKAIDLTMTAGIFPTIIVDLGDVVLAGAPGTCGNLLEDILTHPKEPKTVMTLCAAELVKRWKDCTVGDLVQATIQPYKANSVEIAGNIRHISKEKYSLVGPFLSGVEFDPGVRLVVQVRHLTLVITSLPDSAQDPAFYTSVGINLDQLDIILVKSHNTFKPAYDGVTQSIRYANTPGPTAIDPRSLQYQHLPRPLFPIDKEDFVQR